MPVTAQLHDGRTLEFPDGTDPAVVQATVKKMLATQPQAPAPEPPKPSARDRIVSAAMRGLPSGPLGLVTQLASEGTQLGSEALDRAAYKAGGAVTDFTGSPEAGFAANVATQAVPALLTGNAAGKALAPVGEWAGTQLMRSALKSSKTDVLSGAGPRAWQTMLEEGINVSQGGAQKLQRKIDAIRDAIVEKMRGSTATVDKGRVASRIQDEISTMEGYNPTPQAAREAMEKVYNDFLTNPLVQQNIPVSAAQKLKQGIYKVLSDEFGELGSATVQAQKGLGRGFKEEISAAVPGVDALNKKQAPLINAGEQLLSREAVAGNKDPATFALLAGNPLAAAALQATRSEMVKSILARMFYSGRERVPQAAAGATEAVLNPMGDAP